MFDISFKVTIERLGLVREPYNVRCFSMGIKFKHRCQCDSKVIFGVFKTEVL